MITVVFLREKRNLEVEGNSVAEVISKLSLLREQYVFIKNGKIICEDESLSDGDTLELFPVASGG
jgi:sulfur carrier protein ThiS